MFIKDKKLDALGSPKATITLLTIAVSAAVFINYFVSSYLNIRITDALSMDILDGWCAIESESIGGHCFGDYSGPLQSASNKNPWEGAFGAYPPFAFAILKIFGFIGIITGYKFALLTYLMLSVCSLLLPILHTYYHSRLSIETTAKLIFVMMASAPMIVVIDRGNLLAFVYPLAYLYLYNCNERPNSKRVIFYATTMVLVKPQLVLLLLLNPKMRNALKIILTSSVAYLISFLIYPSNYFGSIFLWVKSTINYANYGGVAAMEPVNVSIKSTLNIIAKGLNFSPNQQIFTVLNLVLVTTSLVIFWKRRHTRSYERKTLILLLITTLFTGTCFQYYLILLFLPLLLQLSTKPKDEEGGIDLESLKKIVRVPYCILLIAISTPVAIPWSIFPFLQGKGWENISISWLPVQIVLNLTGLVIIYVDDPIRKNTKKPERPI